MKNAEMIATDAHQAKLHVASLAVHLIPQQLASFKRWLAGFAVPTEIHAESTEGKLVLVLETHNDKDISTLISAINSQTGIISAALVYHEIVTEETDTP